MTNKVRTALTLAALGAAGASAALLAPRAHAAPGGVTRAAFGKTGDGTPVEIYTLTNRNGLRARIMTYGATLTELHVPDRRGRMGDVVLGFSSLAPYLKGHPFFGSTVGRYANRIARGQFKLNGKTYTLAINNDPNHLHGGVMGFDKRIWKATPVSSPDGPALRLTYQSHDGEEGYPGTLKTTVTYTLTHRNALRIEYVATVSGRSTPVNLTNHSYFNLRGRGDILNHVAEFRANRYTPVDDTLIPTGKVVSVSGTPFDFEQPHRIGARINQVGKDPKGYDHNFVKNDGETFALAARVYEPATGRVLEMYTDEPAFQFYTANFLDGTLKGKNGVVYRKHSAFCLEAQHYPDSPNHPDFPSTVVRPGETYRQRTEYRFSTRPAR